MEKRNFERSRWFLMAALVAVSMVVFGAVTQSTAAPLQVPQDAPSAALYAVAWNTAGITTDTNSSAYLTQHYAYHDLFCSIDLYSTGRLTITMQSSPAGTTYYDTYQLVATEVDTDVYTRVLSYGRYERLKMETMNTNLITPTCTSVFFNNWFPSNYTQQKE
ncbi:MAG: hypothetical protein AMJ88_13440 [Anaerolineae bacterium SM23_ 63]|nr:MAG: hypothetical protein AMJ88_13440 [Anaerolineae bacterium SM23_ 63]